MTTVDDLLAAARARLDRVSPSEAAKLAADGALLVDLLPSSRTRLGSARGMRELPESSVDDAMAVGVADQARAFARAVRGEAVDIPGAQASVRATDVGRAVIAATASGGKVEVVRAT